MNLTVGMITIIFSLVYSFILNILFFCKEHINTKETKIFGVIVFSNFIGLLLELACICSIDYYGVNHIVSIIINKMFLLYFLFFLLIFSAYVVNVAEQERKNKHIWEDRVIGFIKKIMYFLFAFSAIAIWFLDITLYGDNGVAYSYGSSVNLVYFMAGLCVIGCLFYILVNIKNITSSKNIPILSFLIVVGILTIVQKKYPEVTVATSLETIIIFIMYHTIENPDVKMVQQLEVARDAADKANNAKTDFLSSMSHEIRTPLNAIVGFSDCIMDAKDLGEAQENAKEIVNASQTLLEIVNGILDISKIEAGKIEIVNSDYNAPDTFLELAKLITPKMHEKGLDFTYKIAPDIPKTLYGDHANLKKIVTNLLSNACKYTEHGYVHYEVNCINTKDVTKLIISVEDSGRGVKRENIDKLFSKFQRLDEDRNTTIEGTGLGLAITKQLIELMGGKIIVHSIYGEGSKFTVVLNQRIDAVPVEKKHHVQTTLDLNNVRILIVDDTPLNLKVASKVLEKYNANSIVTCDSGFECLEKIKRGEIYDLILLDDMMPKMSGVETLHKLKEIPGFRIPVIALTANAITGMKEKYLSEGFDDYLAKPIEKEQLIQVINQILGRNITEELDFSKEEKISNYINGPVVPSIRGEEIPNVNDMEKAEEERKKNDIIPVEDNIEEILGDKLERNYKEEEVTLDTTPVHVDHIGETETLEDASNEAVPTDILPVVDIDIPTEMLEKDKDKVYDRNYLEENGVDVNHALELLGDMDMYNDTISDFMSEVEDKWNNIVEYKTTNNMPEYAILVHSLKSDCKYLGFMTLADIAYQHELKSKENDSNYVNEHFNELEEEYKKVLELARTYVDHLSS